MALTQEQRDLLLKKNHENIARKLAAGKTLTNTERRLLEAKTDSSEPDESDWVTSDAKLSAIFGPLRASFPRFRKKYQDAPKPRDNGDHSVPAWRKFFQDHPALLSKSEDKLTLTNLEIKAALDAEKLRERKFKNDHNEGLYLPKEKTLAEIRDLTELLKNKLRSALEDELPPLIQNQPAPIIRTHMKELVDRLCREFQEATLP